MAGSDRGTAPAGGRAADPPAGPDLVTLGEALVALVATDGVPLLHAARYDRWVVGAESNVAVGVARLGHRVAFCGRVGDDTSGEVVRRFLRGEGVDDAAVRTTPGRATGLIVRDAPSGRPVDLVYHRTAAAGSALSPGDVPLAVVRSARATHLTGISAMLGDGPCAAVQSAAHAARGAGRYVTLDPNVRRRLGPPAAWRSALEPLVGLADAVLVGDEELAVLGGGCGIGWFLDRGAPLVVVKRGAAGATATDGTTTWTVPARPVPLVDPVGAGDAFAAGWISAWLRGKDVEDGLREGAAVAACVVATRGDVDGLPTAAERDHVLADGTDVRR
ncbi:sugar kinase [Cellulosimicrobium cellulans]|uniref:sugar kinase n=1 Tax=Cellulosimicrobium cellulans TaxID=1710 RepID=UPI00130E585F|nr:sugar kinase [Cellulosimicrobium cellulans]